MHLLYTGTIGIIAIIMVINSLKMFFIAFLWVSIKFYQLKFASHDSTRIHDKSIKFYWKWHAMNAHTLFDSTEINGLT